MTSEELKRLRGMYEDLPFGGLENFRVLAQAVPRLLDMVEELQARKKKADTLAKAVKAWRDGDPDDSLGLYGEMMDAMVDYRRRNPRRQALGLDS